MVFICADGPLLGLECTSLLLQFVFETDRHNGIGEMLEILGR
jgi:hypothetical protein